MVAPVSADIVLLRARISDTGTSLLPQLSVLWGDREEFRLELEVELWRRVSAAAAAAQELPAAAVFEATINIGANESNRSVS